MGVLFNSKYRSHPPKSLYGKYKIKDDKDDNPGPGEYILPSDFGIYRSKNSGEDVPREKVRKYENYLPVIREQRLEREEAARMRREAKMNEYTEKTEEDVDANKMDENNKKEEEDIKPKEEEPQIEEAQVRLNNNDNNNNQEQQQQNDIEEAQVIKPKEEEPQIEEGQVRLNNNDNNNQGQQSFIAEGHEVNPEDLLNESNNDDNDILTKNNEPEPQEQQNDPNIIEKTNQRNNEFLFSALNV